MQILAARWQYNSGPLTPGPQPCAISVACCWSQTRFSRTLIIIFQWLSTYLKYKKLIILLDSELRSTFKALWDRNIVINFYNLWIELFWARLRPRRSLNASLRVPVSIFSSTDKRRLKLILILINSLCNKMKIRPNIPSPSGSLLNLNLPQTDMIAMNWIFIDMWL